MKKGKGIVLQIESDAVILLGRDGSFQRIPLPHPLPLLGEEMEYAMEEVEGPEPEETGTEEAEPGRFLRRGAISVRRFGWVAVLLLLILSGLFLFLPLRPEASYIVALDINPNLELYVDAKDRVQEVRFYGEETEAFLKGLALEGKEITMAVREITEKAKYEGYMKAASSSVIATVIPIGEMKKKEEILQKVDQALKSFEKPEQVVLTSADQKKLEEAHNRKLPVYKYAILTYIEKKGSKVTEEEMKASTSALMKEFDIHLDDLLRSSDILHAESPSPGTPPWTPADQHEDPSSRGGDQDKSLSVNQSEDRSLPADQNAQIPPLIPPKGEDGKGGEDDQRDRRHNGDAWIGNDIRLHIGGLEELVQQIREGLKGEGEKPSSFGGSSDRKEKEESGEPPQDRNGNREESGDPPKDRKEKEDVKGSSPKGENASSSNHLSPPVPSGTEEKVNPSLPSPGDKEAGLNLSISILGSNVDLNLFPPVSSGTEEVANPSLPGPGDKEAGLNLSISILGGKLDLNLFPPTQSEMEEKVRLSLPLLGGQD